MTPEILVDEVLVDTRLIESMVEVACNHDLLRAWDPEGPHRARRRREGRSLNHPEPDVMVCVGLGSC